MASQPTVVHYDFADIRYSSFYSTGFLLNARRYDYRFEISTKPPRLLATPAVAETWHKGIAQGHHLLYRFKSDSEDFFFCVDALDHSANYNLPLLQNVQIYFKVNYDPKRLPQDTSVTFCPDRIRPVLPFFPLRSGRRLRRLPRLFPYRAMAWDGHAILRRIIDAPRVPQLGTLRTLRDSAKCCDVFFVSAYYPGEQHASEMAFRYQLMAELDRQGLHRSVFGFATKTALPEPFNRYAMSWLSFRDYLRALAGARVAIYVRGLHGCISFKFGEYLCLGASIVGQTIANNREELGDLPHFRDQFAFDEPQAIARQAATLLGQSANRRVLSESNARVFDEMLSPEAATAHVLESLGVRRRRD